MVEAVVLWNEPNNLSHWNFKLDPNWERFADMVKRASAAIRAVNPALPIVLGGVSSCDIDFLRNMAAQGVMEAVDAVGVHGFPLDWNHWQLAEWPDRVREAHQVTGKPVWVTEVGVSSFGAEEVQEFGLARTLDLLQRPPERVKDGGKDAVEDGKTAGVKAERIHWYSLFDLPPSWAAETRHKEAEGSAYYRHYYLGLLKANGEPKLAERLFPTDGSAGLCQWFHFEDHRLDEAVRWMHDHGCEYLRTGLSWADSYRPNAEALSERQMDAHERFRVALTLCFTPGHLGLEDHHTSPPKDNQQFADFATWAVERYAPATKSQLEPTQQETVGSL